MTIKYLSIHGSSHELDVSFFLGNDIIDSIKKVDARASSSLIPTLDSMLNRNKSKLEDLAFIAVDRGPGAFTSLRVIIASVNGIGFSNKMPLVGINGLEALAMQAAYNNDYNPTNTSLIVSLLNAYNGEAYYLISKIDSIKDKPIIALAQGCNKIEHILTLIKDDFGAHNLLFCGQGSELYKKQISLAIEKHSFFMSHESTESLSKIIGQMALCEWNNKQHITYHIEPLYLKDQRFAVKHR